jgi:hypothetical protein
MKQFKYFTNVTTQKNQSSTWKNTWKQKQKFFMIHIRTLLINEIHLT